MSHFRFSYRLEQVIKYVHVVANQTFGYTPSHTFLFSVTIHPAGKG